MYKLLIPIISISIFSADGVIVLGKCDICMGSFVKMVLSLHAIIEIVQRIIVIIFFHYNMFFMF